MALGPPTLPAVYRFGPDLRATLSANLTSFPRRPYGGADPGLRPAAVAVCIVAGEGETAGFLLTRRAARLRSHAGQWALPGGRCDPGETPAAAALRELWEEVGLALTDAEVLGLLDDYPTRSGYVITPVVLWCDAVGSLTPNAGEVEAIYRVPLADLDHPEAPRLLTIPESDAPVVQMWAAGSWIHAPTAAVLLQLREVGLRGADTRVSHLEQPVWAWR